MLVLLSLLTAPVFLGPAEASAALERGAVVLDARGASATWPYLPGAAIADWTLARVGPGREGRLDLDRARAYYASRGVREDRAVLVYGSGLDGFGEEGRVWWDLRMLGHPEVRILDGGVGAWIDEGLDLADAPIERPMGQLSTRPAPPLRADRSAVAARGRQHAAAASGRLIDVRTREEYDGATPYFASRGGHIPGAVHVPWTAALDARGRLDPSFPRRLPAASGTEPLVVYCTGGVRSAFVVAVLTHFGIAAQNYDGSWWEYARSDLPVSRLNR